jgi:hypothetical protein
MGFIRKTAVYLMTALLFVATTNIVLSAHICAGELINLTLYDKGNSCPCSGESGENEADAAGSSDLNYSGSGLCCSSFTVETDKLDVIHPVPGIKETDHQLATLQLMIYAGNSPQYDNLQKTAFKPYLLPHTDRDIPVLIQSFLL